MSWTGFPESSRKMKKMKTKRKRKKSKKTMMEATKTKATRSDQIDMSRWRQATNIISTINKGAWTESVTESSWRSAPAGRSKTLDCSIVSRSRNEVGV